MNGYQRQYLFPGKTIHYLAKNGSDANNGLTGDTPLASTRAAFNLDSGDPGGQNFNSHAILLVGDGIYRGPLNKVSKCIQADGKVVFDLAGGAANIGTDIDLLEHSGNINDCTFLFVGSMVSGCGSGGSIPVPRVFNRCNINFVSGAAANCTPFRADSPNAYRDCNVRNVNGPYHRFLRTNAFGINVTTDQFQDSYADATSFITLADASQLVNSNVVGKVRVAGDSFGFTDLATFKQNYNLTGRTDLISVADPGFNNALRQNYTLKITSPHLAAGIGPAHLRYALSWYVASTCQPGQVCTPANTWLVNSADGSIVNFLTLQGFSWSQQGSLYITENTSNVFTANYRTAPMQIASTAQIIRSLPVFTGLNFNTDYPASEADFDSNQPDVQNNNVPAVGAFLPGTVGRMPRRLSVGLRWSTRQAPQSNAPADWVTGGLFPAFQIDAEPTWNQSASLGNADPGFDANPASVQSVRALWVQLDYTARNNYYK